MKVLFASVQCSKARFQELFGSAIKKPGQQVQKYDRLLAEGLAAQDGVRVCSLTDLPVTQQNCARLFVPAVWEHGRQMDYYYPGVLNIHRWKDILAVVRAFLFCMRRGNGDWLYLCDVLCAPVSLGVLLAAKIRRKKVFGLVTDVPDILFESGDKVYHTVSNYVIRECAGYILLTEQMNELVNQDRKPYLVIEGMTDQKLCCEQQIQKPPAEKRICMYTGTLDRKYGIELLLKGFLRAAVPDAELHIYGDGNFRAELEAYAKEYNNIRYFGEKMNDEILLLQRQADVLVNPRPSSGDFTKYSFPSKNMEYMVSGVPMLAAVLDGIPAEYTPYYFRIETETEEGYAEAIRDVLCMDQAQLRQMGEQAREFVLKEKNNETQAGRLARFLKQYGM